MNPLVAIDSVRFAGLSGHRAEAQSRSDAADDEAGDKIRRLHCRILVVDNSEAFRESFAERLRDVYDAFVITAPNAEIARQKLTDMALFDLVLLDVEMPDEDGIAACQRMRIDGVGGRIVLMSSEAENEERARAIGEEFFEKSDDAALEAVLMTCKGERPRD